jgi:hypothetical protein
LKETIDELMTVKEVSGEIWYKISYEIINLLLFALQEKGPGRVAWYSNIIMVQLPTIEIKELDLTQKVENKSQIKKRCHSTLLHHQNVTVQ